MTDLLETRLRRSAAELRELASREWPPPIPERRRSRAKGVLVLGGAFAIVIAVFGLLPLLGGISEPDVGAAPDTTTATAPPPTDYDCSAAGVPVPEEVPGLPASVAATRGKIVEAAASCSFDALERLAVDGLVTSFGGGGVEMLRVQDDEGNALLATMLRLLAMSHTVEETGDGRTIYVWPAAFGYDHWEEIPAEQIEELYSLYTEAELDESAGFGSYVGWRLGIEEDGTWVFFVAGD